MTKDKTVTMSREKLRQEFEAANSDRAWFVQGGTSESDTPEGFVYGDFTTDMCWTCYFEARQIAAPVVERQEPIGYGMEEGGQLPENCHKSAGDAFRALTQKDWELIAANATIAQQAKLIEYLQGVEPVGEVADMKYNRVQFYRATGDTSKPYLLPGTKLYTSPPAPVAAPHVTLQQVLKAYDYAESHPHKYLRGTTNWCAAVAHELNACLAKVKELNQ